MTPQLDERLPKRFWDKVVIHPRTQCWIWTGSCAGKMRYGYMWWNGTNRYTHRLTYEAMVGPIPEGLDIDHVKARGCRGPQCCNPAHLEPVSRAENLRRGDMDRRSHLTHCARGHEFTDYRDRRGHRACLICHRAADVARQRRTE